MRGACPHLSEVFIDSGHWMAQEKPAEVNAALAHWLATEIPQLWLRKTTP
jgi:pimeloyl-ACP methyl ester carboxylesterase